MEYVVDGTFRVGQGYKPFFRGRAFCWEKENESCYSTDNLADLGTSLRNLNLLPIQVENVGTKKPFNSEPLNKVQLEELLRKVSRPLITIIKLRDYDKSREIHQNPVLFCFFGEFQKMELGTAIKILNEVGCEYEDLILREGSENSYTILNIKDKAYIISRLKRI